MTFHRTNWSLTSFSDHTWCLGWQVKVTVYCNPGKLESRLWMDHCLHRSWIQTSLYDWQSAKYQENWEPVEIRMESGVKVRRQRQTCTLAVICCPSVYVATISPLAYLLSGPGWFSLGPCHGSPQTPHLPPFCEYWTWEQTKQNLAGNRKVELLVIRFLSTYRNTSTE